VRGTNSFWTRISLQAKIFVYSVLLVIGLVGAVLLFSYLRASRLASESLDRALETTRSLYANLEVERLEKLELVNSVVAESPIFKAIVAEADAATALDSAREMLPQVGSDFIIITDSEGVVLARTDLPGRAGEDASEIPLIRLALEGESAGGVWREGERLDHVVAVPLTVGPTILGSVTSGYAIGDQLAQEIKRFAGCEVVFFAGEGTDLQLAGSTLAENSPAFRDWLARQKTTGESNDLQVELGGETYQATLVPLETIGGEVEGVFAALRSRDRELGAFRAFQRSVLGVGMLTLGLAILASFIVSRGIARPIKKLVTVTDRIREGDYRSEVEVESEDEIGALAASFRALVGELREKELMEKYISRSAAEMIQKTARPESALSRREPVTVLFSDLRAFASFAEPVKPRAVLSRVNHSLEKEAELVDRYGGQVDKFVGDRMMAFFKGPEMVWSAVRCANAIRQYLGEEPGEDVSPFLPSIGMATGDVMFGSVGTSERLDFTLLGPAVHVAARLCDEARPGNILLSDDTYQVVRDRVSAELLSTLSVPGVASPVVVYLVSGGTTRQPAIGTGGLAATDSGEDKTQSLVVPALSVSDLRPGFVLAGRYEIQRVLGEGGMGMVFQALDRELDEPVALKVLRPEIASTDPHILDRFKQEIRVARRVTHRNVVRTFDIGEERGIKFITMEFVQGITLKRLVQAKGALPLEVGLGIAKQTCVGLTAAHEQGVVHRDVKPQNIILTPTSEVKIMDFGIARPLNMAEITAAGLVMGTPQYMSPEQAQGKQDLDERSDIYSLGVVLYEMFTGVLPFRADTPLAIAMKHVQEDPVPPRRVLATIPEPLDDVILRCMKKDRAVRYQKMVDLHADLVKLSAALAVA
jgi:serine/threonine-protein kinase